jgi:DUF4097 and DUF4098 domain-containing protein YvlB
MRIGWIIVIVLVVLLLVCCVAAGLGALFFATQVQVSGERLSLPGGVENVSAAATSEQTLQVDGPAVLEVANIFGDVDIRAWEGQVPGEIRITATKTAWGRDAAEAEQDLEDIEVIVSQEEDMITIQAVMPETNLEGQADSVDLTILVPEETSVDAVTRMGQVSLSGTQGDAQLESQFGSVEAEDIRGALTANSSNGQITARNIESGSQDIQLQTDFGSIRLEQASAQSVQAGSRNGEVRLENVEAQGEVSLNSDFGELRFAAGSAEQLRAENRNGPIHLSELNVVETLYASSNFGEIRLDQANAAAYELKTTNGAVTVDGAQGSVQIETNSGFIEVSGGEEASLTLTSRSGALTYRGSLGEGPHQLRTDFGDIRLVLPEGSAFSLDLHTEFGSISSEFEVDFETESGENTWQGTVNGGGPLLSASTRNGNIILEILSP